MNSARMLVALLASMVLLVSALPSTAPPASAATARTPLARTTTLQGSKTTRMRVTIPKRAVLRSALDGGSSGVRVKGRGRFVGFAIVEDVPEIREDTLIVVGGRVRTPSGHQVFQMTASGAFGPGGPPGDAIFPPGDYIIYLVTDGRPATVTLNLKGLPGSVKLRPQRRVAKSAIRAPGARLPVPIGAAYSSGADAAVSGKFLLVSALTAKNLAFANETTTHCLYEGAPSGPAAYGPGCPQGHAVVTNATCASLCSSDGAALGTAVGTVRGRGDITIGQGFFQSTAGVQDQPLDPIRYTALWLSLNAAPRTD